MQQKEKFDIMDIVEGVEMKKQGFTLAELLGVIVILGLIAMITIPAVNKSIKRYRNDLYQIQLDNIIEAARSWGTDHLLELPETEGASITVTIATLQEEGYLKDEIKNPIDKEPFKTSATVQITRSGKGYQYTIDESQL